MMTEEQKRQLIEAIPIAYWCDNCYFHTQNQKCMTIGKRYCNLREVTVERISKILGVE
jgi:predicted RNA-binding protein with PUA domain